MRKFIKILISLGLFLLLIAPIIAIFLVSKEEVKKYEPKPVPPLIEKAYGQVYQVIRADISETITISGVFVSTKEFFMEMPKLKKPYEARMLIETGDEISEGQIVGYSVDLKTEILATAPGIVKKVNLGTTSYITLESIDDIALECNINDTILAILRREKLKLTTQEGEEVRVLSISRIQNDKGGTTVYFSVPNGVYGQKLEELQLHTGRVFYQSLVVETSCLFHLYGDDKKWYVRTIDANGNYLEDVEVNVGYTNGKYVAISGVPEGTLCDGGYSKIAGETDE